MAVYTDDVPRSLDHQIWNSQTSLLLENPVLWCFSIVFELFFCTENLHSKKAGGEAADIVFSELNIKEDLTTIF